MKKYDLLSISPLDGRYYQACKDMSLVFSEYNLIKSRIFVEVKWLIHLSNINKLKGLPKFTKNEKSFLLKLHDNFTVSDAEKVKEFEDVTKHDVKAVEYFIKSKIKSQKRLNKYKEYIHICCTSEDINNLAYALMIKQGRLLLSKKMNLLENNIKKKIKSYKSCSMLSYTHGQAATPTTMGKEFLNFYSRLANIHKSFDTVVVKGKFNGATGNYSAHSVTFPNINWQIENKKFIKSLGIDENKYTTQIEPHDYICELANTLSHYNSILIGFSQDMWSYISKNYFIQKNIKGEVGSSTMPHKINPINFENAEGNLGLSNSLLKFFSEKLVISRLQRDLSDSTVLRNLGISFAYSYLSYDNLLIGFNKISINKNKISKDLSNAWEVLAEPIQMIARKYQISNSYELLKKITRGQKVTEEIIKGLIISLNIPQAEKNLLLNLSPEKYIGYAAKLCKK